MNARGEVTRGMNLVRKSSVSSQVGGCFSDGSCRSPRCAELGWGKGYKYNFDYPGDILDRAHRSASAGILVVS